MIGPDAGAAAYRPPGPQSGWQAEPPTERRTCKKPGHGRRNGRVTSLAGRAVRPTLPRARVTCDLHAEPEQIVSAPPLPPFLSVRADGVTMAIKLQPRAARNEFGEPRGAELPIRVTAPPVDAAANEALLRLLAEKLDCPRGWVQLVRGHTSRHKLVKVWGVPADEVLHKLAGR
jgi:uncharacterized protein (TIGR00251 family)